MQPRREIEEKVMNRQVSKKPSFQVAKKLKEEPLVPKQRRILIKNLDTGESEKQSDAEESPVPP